MRLIDPQPMETLPEYGHVILQYTRNKQHGDFVFVDEWPVHWVRDRIITEDVQPIAWSYTATINPNEEEPT